LSEKSSLLTYRLKKTLDHLASKGGRGTELISLYIPPDRQISDVINNLKQEYGTASNIKSRTTRKNVQDAIEKVIQRLKLFKRPPPTGLVILCGSLPQNGPGSEKIELYVIVPPEPINVYFYRCNSSFQLDPLREMIKERDTYGILVIDNSEAIFAKLTGRRLEITYKASSGLPGKHRAGGQSARRFERLREAEVNEYFKRIGRYANRIFLDIPDLKGIIVGGPGPTKNTFVDGDYLNYTLKQKILAVIDTAYAEEQGVEEVVEKSSEILQKVRYFEEKKLVQDFLYEVGHDTGLAIYGENDVRNALLQGIVKQLLLSEDLNKLRVKIKCSSCGYTEYKTIRRSDLAQLEQKLIGSDCTKCNNSTLAIAETEDLIDELATLADNAGTEVEIISSQTEEGVELKESFGGIAAILQHK